MRSIKQTKFRLYSAVSGDLKIFLKSGFEIRIKNSTFALPFQEGVFLRKQLW